MAIALRYIPDIQRDYHSISQAQQARGVELGKSEPFFARLKNSVSILMPLILTSRRKGPKPVYAGGRPPKKYPFYCMFHPVEGYSDLKSEKSGSFLLANGILLAFFIVSILMRQLTGFAFNENRTDQFNLWVTLCSTMV